MEITGHSVEYLEDPFGLLKGERFEFLLDISVDEEDELYSELGTGLRIILSVEDGQQKIVQYNFFEKESGKVLDFELEEDEEEMVLQYCKNNADA
ncbi:DUF6509 family protein [Bacillus sp. B-jedd]|uniref:DUF6509 family protein n=1 Tax=Bacillus sp. B-jedd TaxID=1476857 RepID=UPI0005155F2D|nr:DUF6509 family protein [Bacillus sp. B-jedd]CEG27509.1 hypothetical protein BN1002_02376 [Bacillus sp. B-jedd]